MTAYTASNPVPLATLPTTNGVVQQFLVGTTNTGGSTFAPDGLTAAPIFGLGGAQLQGGEIVAEGIATLVSYVGPLLNSSALCWILFSCTGGAEQVGTGTGSQQAATVGQIQKGSLVGAAAAGTANALTATIASTLTALTDGQPLTIIASAANTTAATLTLTLGTTTLSALAIVKGNNQALNIGDIPASGYPIELNYSATYGAYVMQNPATWVFTAALAANTGPIADQGAALVGFDGGTLQTQLESKINRVVDSIASLRTLSSTTYTRAFVTGYYVPHDGGGGAYQVDPSDTTSADNGGTIILASDGARWKLSVIGLVSVDQFGAQGVATNATPTVDATSAWQNAVNACGAVSVPDKAYLIAGSITMPIGGKFTGVSDHGTLIPGTDQVAFGSGSFIYLTSTSVSPFIYYSGNQFIGLTFYYPNQLRSASTPTVYPPTFLWNSVGSSTVLTNNIWRKCQSVNAYAFINVLVGHLDFEFLDLEGCVVSAGIEIDGGGGTDTLNNIRFSYYYFCQSTDAIAAWIAAHGIGIAVGRSDAIQAKQIFVGSMNAGIRFFQGSINTTTGPYGEIDGLSFDGNNYGIYSEATHPIGMNIVGLISASVISDIMLPVVGSQTSSLQVTGFKFWGTKPYIASVQQSSCALRLSHGEFASYTSAGMNVSNISCDIEMSGVKCFSSSAPPIAIGAELNSLVLIGNLFNAAPSLYATAATLTQIQGNAGWQGTVDTVASSSTIAILNLSDLIEVTGTTTVTTITGGWTGRKVFFFCPGGLTFGIGGNIAGNVAVPANDGIEYTFDGTFWRPSI